MARPLPLLLLLGVCTGVSLAASLATHRISRRQAAPRGAEVSKSCLRCICKARRCDFNSGCRNGVCGGFEISEPYFDHSNVTSEAVFYRDSTYQSCTTDAKCAITVVELYMRKLATDCDEDGTIDCDDMMMTHYYGIEGCIGARSWVEFTEDWKRYRSCAKHRY